MKPSPHVPSKSQVPSLVDLAQLIMDYETNPDFADSDLQRGILIDMCRVITSNPHQLLQIIPSRLVARALCLALRRRMYEGKRGAELLAAATYYCLTRAMVENPRDLSLYKERYELLLYTGTYLHRPLQLASEGLDNTTRSPLLLKVKAWMLLTDLLYAEEFLKKDEILSTHRRALMERLDNDQMEVPLYQHINNGLEYHEKLTHYLVTVLKSDEIWDFRNPTTTSAQ